MQNFRIKLPGKHFCDSLTTEIDNPINNLVAQYLGAI
jgi:hypothetical protein